MLNRSSFPLVSVILPIHNAEKYISETLASIENQKYENLQLIAIDDHSTDSSIECLEKSKLKIEILRLKEKSGPARARNLGLELAKGNFIAFVDADDLWSEDHLERSLRLLTENPDASIVKSYTVPFSIIDGVKNYRDKTLFVFLLGSSLFKREVFSRVGNFNEEMFQASDADFHLRCIEKKLKIIEDSNISLYYRKHDSNITKDIQNALKARVDLLKKN